MFLTPFLPKKGRKPLDKIMLYHAYDAYVFLHVCSVQVAYIVSTTLNQLSPS